MYLTRVEEGFNSKHNVDSNYGVGGGGIRVQKCVKITECHHSHGRTIAVAQVTAVRDLVFMHVGNQQA